MDEYLSREFVLSCVDDFLSKTDMPIAAQFFYDCFRECEAADVQPVKRGQWLQHGKPDDYFWCCSACKKWIIFAEHDLHKHHFCGNCGARMDGDT